MPVWQRTPGGYKVRARQRPTSWKQFLPLQPSRPHAHWPSRGGPSVSLEAQTLTRAFLPAAPCCPQVPRMHQAGVQGLPELQRPRAVHPLLLWRSAQRRLRSGGCRGRVCASAAVCLRASGRAATDGPPLLSSCLRQPPFACAKCAPTHPCLTPATAAVLVLCHPLRKV